MRNTGHVLPLTVKTMSTGTAQKELETLAALTSPYTICEDPTQATSQVVIQRGIESYDYVSTHAVTRTSLRSYNSSGEQDGGDNGQHNESLRDTGPLLMRSYELTPHIISTY